MGDTEGIVANFYEAVCVCLHIALPSNGN